MKKIFLLLITILSFIACTDNQKTYHISMPSFKTQIQEHNTTTNVDGPKVKILEAQISKNTFYSSYFEQSTLNQRIDKSLQLLKDQLIKDVKTILENKGYQIVQDGADYTFTMIINASLYEDKVLRSSGLGGENVESSFMLILEAQNTLASLDGNTTSINSSTKFDDAITINYPIKSQAGFDTFKQVYSAVPTQINENTSASVLEVDNLFIKFYKEMSVNLQTSIPKYEKITTEIKTQDLVEEDTNTTKESNPYQNNEVIIFQ
ncbi:hypothetical protein IY804_01430 [Campylobacter volucris]|uniref:hypothetical protein n=1 Tax=Campylobacter volucris TaxID=1031542 RepID=UPI0018A119AF|nr:hypothetical protein [Campylobacter volucris]MBF7046748.1 hypothetical protein [Campylobacter volucris]